MTRTLRLILSCSIALSVACGASSAVAEVRLAKLISNGMVLQREAPIRIWGWAKPGEAIRIDFLGSTYTTRASKHGEWSATIAPHSAGGPYRMSIKGSNRIDLQDILIGDIWLASGQSNMEMPVGGYGGYPGVDKAPTELLAANFPQIRLFNVKRTIGLTPKDDVVSAGWLAANPASVARFSAVAYFFGRELHQRYGIPIGIIEAAWGGTFAENWMSKSALAPFPNLRSQIDSADNDQARLFFETFLPKKRAWYEEHGMEDRGISGWAAPEFDASTWPTLEVPPRRGAPSSLDGFGGVVWFRKELNIPAESASCDLLIQIGSVMGRPSIFWNGAQLEQTSEGTSPSVYVVPRERVRAGRSVVAVRVVGSYVDDNTVGLFGPADAMKVWTCTGPLPLAGSWSYQTGPDLADFPRADPAIYGSLRPWVPATTLFNAMIRPLQPYRIKGVIWYQGEANALADRSGEYRSLFPALIADWRDGWGYKFPFLLVQLAGFSLDPKRDSAWVELREAQSAALTVPLTGMASAIDIGDAHDIHPRNKQEVGHRLALVAQRVAYGDSVISSGPIYRSIQTEGERLRITYLSVGSGLVVRNELGELRGFEIAAADGRFVRAHALLEGSDVVVYEESIREPVTVRYNWSSFPDGNLFNKEGLPALPFRAHVATQSSGVD